MQSSDDLLAQLRDIRGLDAFPWWPIAPGWWFLLAFLLVCAGGIYFSLHLLRRRYRELYWREEARRTLASIRDDSGRRSDQQRVAALALLLRKLAIRKYGRNSCAGLEGQEWLRWLNRHDPAGFDWMNEGRILIEAPYAPEGKPIRASLIKHLIDGLEGWVR